MNMAVLAAYTVGTFLGIWLGYRRGFLRGADSTLEWLMSHEYLNWVPTPQGVRILKLTQEQDT